MCPSLLRKDVKSLFSRYSEDQRKGAWFVHSPMVHVQVAFNPETLRSCSGSRYLCSFHNPRSSFSLSFHVLLGFFSYTEGQVVFAGTSASLHPDTGENSLRSTSTPSTDFHSRDCNVTAISLSSEGISPLDNHFVVGSVVEK